MNAPEPRTLTAPKPRRSIYTRQIRCEAFLRDDGLWDIDGHVSDARMFDSSSEDRAQIGPGEPFHSMRLRLTIDDSFTVRAVEAVTEYSPLSYCPNVAANFQTLVGLNLGQGFQRALRERLSGANGCTHMVELLGPMATSAHQALHNWRKHTAPQENPAGSERFFNTCFAFAKDSPVAKKRWPHLHDAPGEEA